MPVRLGLVVLGVACAAWTACAQTATGPKLFLDPGVPTPMKAAGPGSAAWPTPMREFSDPVTPLPMPQKSTEAVPSTPPQSLAPGSLAPRSSTVAVSQFPLTQAGQVIEAEPLRPVDMQPIPFSLEDQFQKDYAARRAFRYFVWDGSAVSAFPSTLLWEPLMASKRDPRLQVTASSIDNYRRDYSLETALGSSIGLLRFEPAGRDSAWQLDVFGVVLSRSSPEDLLVSDYRFGIPLTARWGEWQAKLAYERTESHLGDRLVIAGVRSPVTYTKDEVVFGIGRLLWNQLRVYGDVGYSFNIDIPSAREHRKGRFEGGFEWFDRCCHAPGGQPFVAANADCRGENAFNPNVTLQAGWMWRNPFQRLADFRIFGEYYKGHSPYGQFALEREEFYGVGIAGDF